MNPMVVRQQIANAISAMAARPYDWNGTGGLPMRGDVASYACNSLFGDSESLGINPHYLECVGKPEFAMNADGTVELFWARDNRQLILTIQCANVVTYVQCYEDDQTSIDGVIRSNTDGSDGMVRFHKLLRWIYRG